MNEEQFHKTLYLFLKLLIKNKGFLSQLEILREVRHGLLNLFHYKDSDLITKSHTGKNEDLKDLLNFFITISCELEIVSQKMENKSFFFKWIGIKGFLKKYDQFLEEGHVRYDFSESYEHRIQIYTRNYILAMMKNPELKISSQKISELRIKCGLDMSYEKILEKIHKIIFFLGFSVQQSLETGGQTYSINSPFFEKLKHTTDEDLESVLYSNILENLKRWNIIEDAMIEYNNISDLVNDETENKLKEMEQYKVAQDELKNDNEQAGFALLQGSNWMYYMKKLVCIIGRAPIKYGVSIGTGLPNDMSNTTWKVDVDLGQNQKISKQHALICYNFHTEVFEFINISKNFPVKVNGETINHKGIITLSNKSLICIGNQEFYFLLPL